MKRKFLNALSYLLTLALLVLFPLTFNGYIRASAFIDFILYIDPGHGGKDNGTSYLDVYEDSINLAVSEKLYELCLRKNLLAYISRTGDYDLASQYAENRKREDLQNRAEAIAHSGCSAFVSIHVNQYSSPSVYGPMVYYEKSDESSYALACAVQKELNVLAGTEKTVHADDFYIFRKCDQPGILVECGFISNEEERGHLLEEQYQQSLAQAIYAGVYQYYLGT